MRRRISVQRHLHFFKQHKLLHKAMIGTAGRPSVSYQLNCLLHCETLVCHQVPNHKSSTSGYSSLAVEIGSRILVCDRKCTKKDGNKRCTYQWIRTPFPFLLSPFLIKEKHFGNSAIIFCSDRSSTLRRRYEMYWGNGVATFPTATTCVILLAWSCAKLVASLISPSHSLGDISAALHPRLAFSSWIIGEKTMG